MEISEIKVETVASLTLPWQEIRVMPIGDIQLGAQGCQTDKLQRDVEWGLNQNAYFLGMGEYLDILSPSNRAKIRAANLYDTAEDIIEEITEQKIEQFQKLVNGSEGRWLGMLEGHHLYEFRDGSTTDTRIARALKTNFLGTCAFVRLKLERQENTKGKRPVLTCTIWCHHGVGSGIKTSAPLNKLENIMPYFDADIYLIAHQHKKVSTPIDQLYMTRKKPYDIGYRTKILACTGGYLLGYYKGAKQGGLYPRGGYVERGMRPPVALGCIVLYIRPVHSQVDRLDLNVSL